MVGTVFSGWHGRRSSRPYFDELPRLSITDCKAYAPGSISATAQGRRYDIQLVRLRSGCLTVPRLICVICRRSCTVVYLRDSACCYRCAGARYRSHSESPSRRAVKAALKIFHRHQIDYKRPRGKPKWQRWATYDRLEAEALAVFPIIEHDDNAPYKALTKVMAPRRKRGRPKQVAP